jgi:hypothetical protein
MTMPSDLLVARLLEPPPSRMPELALPFAVAGAAAGWLAAGCLANPFIIRHGEGGMQVPATLCAAVVCGIVGRLLSRLSNPTNPFANAHVGWLRLTAFVLLGASMSGAITGGLMIGDLQALSEGFQIGFGFGIPFTPICALVLRAARRAERARMGSIVADADRREVWGILFTTLAVASLVALPDWRASLTDFYGYTVPKPIVATLMAAGAGLATIAFLVADARALVRISGATRGMVPSSDDADTITAGTGVPKVDLGLGDDIFAKLARHAAAYRSRDQAVALVVGCPNQAAAALRRSIRRNIASLVLCACVVAGHVIASMKPAPWGIGSL